MRSLQGLLVTKRALLALLLLASFGAAAEPRRLAVLELEVAPGLRIDRTYFSDLVRSSVHRTAPRLFVMTRESTEVLLNAVGKTSADCAGSCEVEVGRQLGAEFIISGRISQIGSWLTLSLRLFSTVDGQLLESTEVRGKGEDELVEKADPAIAALTSPLGSLPEAEPPRAQPQAVSPREPPAEAPRPETPARRALPEAAISAPPAEAARPGRSAGFLFLGAGALVLGGSAAFDNLSATSKDHRLTGADFAPVAGYALALALGSYGIYRLVKQ